MNNNEFVQYGYAILSSEYDKLLAECDQFIREIEEDEKRRREQK